MTDRTDDPAQDPSGDSERPPAPRQLDRAPGERFRPPGGSTQGAMTPPGSRSRAVLAGSAAAGGGAVVYALLGQVDLGLGLLAVAAFVGWVVAIAIVWGAGAVRPIPRQPLVAVLLGAGAIVAGLLLAWAWSRVEGGVLGPLEYTDQRYGPVAYLEILVAGAVAGLRAR